MNSLSQHFVTIAFCFFADTAGEVKASLLINPTPDIFGHRNQAVPFIPPGNTVDLNRQTHRAARHAKYKNPFAFRIYKNLKVHHDFQFVDQPFSCTLRLVKRLAADDLAGPFVCGCQAPACHRHSWREHSRSGSLRPNQSAVLPI